MRESIDASAEPLPELPPGLSQEERYFALLAKAIRKCRGYKPKFGQSRGVGLTAREFTQLYEADAFYHWLGVDSPLMYAAHKAAGGMTSVYRQIGIGSQWVFFQVLQDHLGLTPEQATWSYVLESAGSKSRKLSLDGRIDLADVANVDARGRIQAWLNESAAVIGLPDETLTNIKSVVFEARQGYKSKDSKRQNADIANASKAYAHLYIPVILLFSTQIDGDVAHRYRENFWLLLTGTVNGPSTRSTYSFCRDVIGYD
ncbi:MAG: hypothetical protein M3Y13_06140, partial [Armatimonadota bacterium]|nr:hypothetical protein [Armatimonadota bacterium]